MEDIGCKNLLNPTHQTKEGYGGKNPLNPTHLTKDGPNFMVQEAAMHNMDKQPHSLLYKEGQWPLCTQWQGAKGKDSLIRFSPAVQGALDIGTPHRSTGPQLQLTTFSEKDRLLAGASMLFFSLPFVARQERRAFRKFSLHSLNDITGKILAVCHTSNDYSIKTNTEIVSPLATTVVMQYLFN